MKFSNIVARWRGSTHDSRIWNNSSLCAKMEGNPNKGLILGDNGYACTDILLTPLLNPRTLSEVRYNRAHISTRNTVERLFGIWKSRFNCLRNTLRFRPLKCCHIIIATAVLHNFIKENNEPDILFIENDEDDSHLIGDHTTDDRNPRGRRQRVVLSFA